MNSALREMDGEAKGARNSAFALLDGAEGQS